MRLRAVSRRTQFSSCDSCRQSRLACDASTKRHVPGQTGSSGSCSRCSSRNRECTFEWIERSKSRLPKDSNTRLGPVIANSSAHPPAVVEGKPLTIISKHYASDKLRKSCAPPYEALLLGSEPESAHIPISNTKEREAMLTRWGDLIRNHGFGAIFGHWLGRYGCPFVNDLTSNIVMDPIELFRELDRYMDNQIDSGSYHDSVAVAQKAERNIQIDQSLTYATQSFTAQWFPSLLKEPLIDLTGYEELIHESWRNTRRDMLKVVNRTSYRSVLTLYLFGQTPIPSGISDEEEMDGISSVVCTQTALLQLQQLRERLRNHQSDGSMSSPKTKIEAQFASQPRLTKAFLDLENRAYWAAVIWDTSNSMTLNIRSSLTSGLRGACLEPAWRLARGFLVGSFHARSEDWCKSNVEISDNIASQITSATAVCSIYTWKTIASVKEALREGVEENDLFFAWDAFLDACNVFQTTVRPLLNIYERQLHFLGQVERLNWYEVVLHFYLGIFLLADALEGAKRRYLLLQLAEMRLDPEQECFNVLKFGLDNKFTIHRPLEGPDNVLDVDSRAKPTLHSVTNSLIAIDPHPRYVITSVRMIKKSIERKYRRNEMTQDAYTYLSTTLLEVLEQLPQSSKMFRLCREHLQQPTQPAAVIVGDI